MNKREIIYARITLREIPVNSRAVPRTVTLEDSPILDLEPEHLFSHYRTRFEQEIKQAFGESALKAVWKPEVHKIKLLGRSVHAV